MNDYERRITLKLFISTFTVRTDCYDRQNIRKYILSCPEPKDPYGTCVHCRISKRDDSKNCCAYNGCFDSNLREEIVPIIQAVACDMNKSLFNEWCMQLS